MNDKTMQRLELEMALHNLTQNIDIFINFQKEVAKLRKVKFDALIAEGFSEEQSLHIVSMSDPLK